ncbi:histone PARylation factor 1 [Ixodes scapularis]|uniref:histone PARylation factor 1 n=1 Tax=Ixodes scapularis TaxID=6945 RepID=UPI001A9D3BE4|nr:histone PARylation factor 1 [Ixodes scapularis]
MLRGTKRKRGKAKASVEKPPCKYGAKCYRKNADHLKNFRHVVAEAVETKNDAAECSGEEDTEFQSEQGESSPGTRHEEKQKVDDSLEVTGTDVASAPDDSGSQTAGDESDAEEMPESPEDVRESIKQKFLVEMPRDFYDFWEFCKSLNKHKPEDALYDTLGLRLVGPFDVLARKLTNSSVKKPDDFLRHWRYYYDPPEMQTVVRGDDETMYHLGYFRDDPNEMPVFVASNAVADGCQITKVAGNLFGALRKEISKALKDCTDTKARSALRKLNGALVEFAEEKRHSITEASKKRPAPQSATFHRAGLVVPVDKRTDVGYRPLPMSERQLKFMLTQISKCKENDAENMLSDDLQNLVTRVNIANDECDYGMGLEFGIDLFCFGDPRFHPTILMQTTLAYQLLNREAFARILKAHLRRRLKTADLSVLSSRGGRTP